MRDHVIEDEKKPLPGVTAKSPSTQNEGKAIYISESGLYSDKNLTFFNPLH